ncbi:major facilitator superfamily domain-containing protein [Stachybotrys elegans]|uniref:Major facilitator superfamily domain-containing protein n=1 Tax=Stachybotrys elegans TaxID=80388 RepID=A0A8K0WKA2_9HYPO|nr:major facilitator superfamily domain-containing protein [Stachybotrys elegans]
MAVSVESCDGPEDQLRSQDLSSIEAQTEKPDNDLQRPAQSPPPLGPPPDGGLTAWTQVAMGWLIIFTAWGYVNSFGSFQTYYTSTLPHTPSEISWIGSIQTWLTFFLSAVSGRLLDAGYFLPTVIVGSLCQVVGIFLMSVSTQYWQLMLTQGVLTGIGSGLFFTPSVAIISTYFLKRRAIAVGVATTGNSIGGLVYPLVVRELIPRVGFAWTTRAIGFINLAALGLACTFLRPRLPPRKSGPIIDWSAFKEPVYLAYASGLFFMIWGVFFTLYYLGSYGHDTLNMTFPEAAILITLINGCGLPARVLIPLIADRYGTLNAMAASCLSLTIVAFCWLAVSDLPGVYVFACLYGITNGAYQSLMPTGVASITKQMDKVGTRMGMMFSILSIAGLTGPPIAGEILAAGSGSYTGPIIWAAVASVLGSMSMVVARGFVGGWKLHVKL